MESRGGNCGFGGYRVPSGVQVGLTGSVRETSRKGGRSLASCHLGKGVLGRGNSRFKGKEANVAGEVESGREGWP